MRITNHTDNKGNRRQLHVLADAGLCTIAVFSSDSARRLASVCVDSEHVLGAFSIEELRAEICRRHPALVEELRIPVFDDEE